MKDERLETLSEMIRRGQPVSIDEAFEVIQYQEELKRIRNEKRKVWSTIFNGTPIGELINFFKKG
jgi:hypothetical protein